MQCIISEKSSFRIGIRKTWKQNWIFFIDENIFCIEINKKNWIFDPTCQEGIIKVRDRAIQRDLLSLNWYRL